MPEDSERARMYQYLVLEYETLGSQIQSLMREYEGHTENMPDEVLLRYRHLASQRDELYNQIKQIEASWFEE